MRKRMAFLAVLISAFACSATKADILLFDIDANPGAWDDAIAGCIPVNHYDFDQDPDYGIAGFDGPLTSAGGGPVSPGILPGKTSMVEEQDGPGGPPRGPGGTGLVAVGPSAGFGNASNSVLANFFVDAFRIDFSESKKAFQFNALTLLGGGTVDILATDAAGNQFFFGGVQVDAGRNLGLLGINGQQIVSVSIFDPNGGAEGVQGSGWTFTVPEPGSAALLGVAAFGMMVFRRRR